MLTITSDFQIALRNLTRNTKRTIVSTLTVSGGILAFCLASGFIAWIFDDMRDSTVRSQLGHIQIVTPGYYEKGIADPYSFLLPGTSGDFEAVSNLPGVVSVAPRLAFSGLASFGDNTVAFIGEGVSPAKEKPISARINIDAGQDMKSDSEASVLLGEGLANSLGVKIGDSIVLLVTTAKGGPNATEVRVVGIFNTTSKQFDDQFLRLPIQRARSLMKVDGGTAWVLLLESHKLTTPIVATLKDKLPSEQYEIIPWTALADFYNKTVVLFTSQIQVVKIIIGLIIVLSISNTQMMSVLERTTEIGTNLALGQRRLAIMRLFLIEGFLIGLMGGIAGTLFAWVAATSISAIGLPMPAAPGMSHGFIGRILFTPQIVFDALVLAVTTTLLASILPAWKASRLNIVDALRYNQ
ncbi:ABC transporter permease [Dechloromonas sp. A34]|uniref:ABC transporter permease n=1 Tax=Dechloromonas sp. A34 TaxID=447588 RepID=UPI0022497DA2|nr:FtsX-like permease family protein [Dechloromonas sp. A34]